jgi:hypothetical protein
MVDIFEDISYITGINGWMTHQLPAVLRAILPYLRRNITDERFWDGAYDPTHTGEIKILAMNEREQYEMWELYQQILLKNKTSANA